MVNYSFDNLSKDLFFFYHTSRIGRYLPIIFFFFFFFFFRFFFNSSDFEGWFYSFQDSSTIYMLALVDLHDFSMWYVSLVIGLVCWCLYAALKNGSWRVSNKNFGLSRVFYFYSFFSFFESVFSFICSKISVNVIKPLFDFYKAEPTVELLIHYSLKINNSFFCEIVYFFSGIKHFIGGVFFPKLYKFFYFPNVYFLAREKYLDFYLFSIRTYGEFFYDDFSPLLSIRRFRHSFFLEVVWATFPTLIIAIILVPSLFLLYSSEEELNPEFTLKVIGHQWFWSYEYSDFFDYSFGSFNAREFKSLYFDSYLVLEDDLPFGAKRLLEVSNRIVLPTNIVLRFLITSGDVLHSWAVPEMGIKVDAVPGRLNQCLNFILRPGVFYGQCSELCGVAHGFMPIVVHAVPLSSFNYWIFWNV